MAYVYRGSQPWKPGTVKEEPPQRKRPPLKPCGTEAAYQRHRYHKEYPCTACYDAHAAYLAAHRGPRPARQKAPCGTYAAMARHLRQDEPLDDACAEARRTYQRARRARKKEA